ncbi:MAG: hypothetical protein JW797_20015 [Bradymonadales bacterium]|nr:hypothetical protein [Bradymonadales bacterium]
MTTAGWLFMGICWTVLTVVLVYSYAVVLCGKEGWSEQDHKLADGGDGGKPTGPASGGIDS